VAVIGTRGRSTLAGMAADALRRRGIDVHSNVPAASTDAPMGSLLSLVPFLAARSAVAAAQAGVRASGATGAIVLRTAPEGPAEQRVVHARACLPHYVLLTNLRPANRPASPARLARAALRAVTPGAVLVSGEADPALRVALRRESERAGVAFVDAAPQRMDVPGLEAVTVLDAFLAHRFGSGLQPAEGETLRRDLQARFRWSTCALPGVSWFDAGAVRDVASTELVIDHLQSQRRHPVTFVAALRLDRPDRLRAWVRLLAGLLATPDTRQVLLAGTGARWAASRLESWGSQVRVVPETLSGLPSMVRRMQSEGQGGAVVLLANRPSSWSRDFAQAMQAGAQAMAARSARNDSSPAPRRIVRPVVAPAPVVPQFGETLADLARPRSGLPRMAAVAVAAPSPRPAAPGKAEPMAQRP
jgi:hypothetical protein